MSDVEIQAPEPSTGPTATDPVFEVPTDPEEYAAWRMGKPPEPKKPAAKTENPDQVEPGKEPKSEEAAASDAPKAAESGAKPDKKKGKAEEPPAPEAGKKSQEPERRAPGAEARIRELVAKNKDLEQRLAELRPKSDVKPAAEPSPAKAEAPPSPKKLEPPQLPPMPDLDTWEGTIEEFQEAVKEHQKAIEEYPRRLAEYLDARDNERERVRGEEAAKRELLERLAEARKRYPEAESVIQPAAKAIFEDQRIPAPVKALVDDSEVFLDLLYVLASKPEDFQDFLATARSDPGKAIRLLVRTEQLVIEELEKAKKGNEGERAAPERDSSGKFQKVPEKKVTEAPPPPAEVGGRVPPPDEEAAAARNQDFAAFRRTRNQRELSRYK